MTLDASKKNKGRKLPITAIVPTRNEEQNLDGCLRSLAFCEQVIVIDSGSTDTTPEIARRHGAEFHQFDYKGGWPKKRQWAMENLKIRNPWTLLVDADERVSGPLRRELDRLSQEGGSKDGYWVPMKLIFLGRVLNHGASGLSKLSFFKSGNGRFECLFAEQDASMGDMEIHEHLIVDGEEAKCRGWLLHENVNSLFRYIDKHNQYSEWSAEIATLRRAGKDFEDARKARLDGNQADRRRALMNRLWQLPAAGLLLPILRFIYFYFFCLGFLDGREGFYYCGFKAVQAFHIMAKVHEKEFRRSSSIE